MATSGECPVDRDDAMCPFLVPVTADRMFVYPVGAFCRRPGCSVKIPAPATLARICSTARYRTCPGLAGATAS